MFGFKGRMLASCIALAVALLTSTHGFADVVYEADQAQENAIQVAGNGFVAVGDDVTLAGTARFLTDVSVPTTYLFDATHTSYTPNLQLTLYQNSGGLPGAEIATAHGVGFLEIGQSNFGTENITFALPFVQVPSSFVFAVRDLNSPDNNFGIGESNGPSVGSTSPTFVVSSNGTTFTSGSTGFDIGATINAVAVPEPSVWMLLGVGAVVAGIFRGRRREMGASS